MDIMESLRSNTDQGRTHPLLKNSEKEMMPHDSSEKADQASI